MAEPETKIICDIWGGELSQDLLASYTLPIDEALVVAKKELDDGFLVNMRAEENWQDYEPFDERRQLNG